MHKGFINVPTGYSWHWSSTTVLYPSLQNNAWMSLVDLGWLSHDVKSLGIYVWPVRTNGISGVINIPKTGQTTCYNVSGSLIDCTGTDQDGDLQTGIVWPSPRFNDNGNLTITDNLTGLIWPQDSNAPGPVACNPGVTKTWQGSLDYIVCLNTNNYLNHNDWRLPNVNELASLVHAGQPITADWLNTQGFSNVEHTWYWSSTTFAGDTGYAAGVIFTGNLYGGPISATGVKTSSYKVWPVRGGP